MACQWLPIVNIVTFSAMLTGREGIGLVSRYNLFSITRSLTSGSQPFSLAKTIFAGIASSLDTPHFKFLIAGLSHANLPDCATCCSKT